MLHLSSKTRTVPDEVLALALDELHGPDAIVKQFSLREAETPDDDDLYLGVSDRLPASFGQPSKLRLNMRELATPLRQLGALTRLRELTVDVAEPAAVLAHVRADNRIEKLTIDGEGRTELPPLSRFPSLVALDIDWLAPGFDLALPALARLRIPSRGALVALDTPALAHLDLIHTAAPDYAGPARLPLRSPARCAASSASTRRRCSARSPASPSSGSS